MSLENKLLSGKRVMVLGASRGIGRGIVERASSEGGQVLAVARGKDDLARLAGLGIRFVALVPTNIMPETELGQAAANCHARDLGVPPEKFLESMDRPRLSPVDVVEAVIKTAVRPPSEAGSIFKIYAHGLVAAN